MEPPSSSAVSLGVDPLLKDLSGKKEIFRRHVESLVKELEETRRHVASQEHVFAIEAFKRQEAETKVKIMEKEMESLNKNLEERVEKLVESESAAQMLVEELGDIRLQLSATRAIALASAQSAESAVLQCSILVKELEDKNGSLKVHETYVDQLEKQLHRLHSISCDRECFDMQLKDEFSETERKIMQALVEARGDQDNGLWRFLDADFVEKNLLEIKKRMEIKDSEIAKLKDEIMALASHLELNTREMDSQLEKHYQKNQELKKKVLKMDFSLQELRTQARKLRRREDMKSKTIEEMRNQLAALQHPHLLVRIRIYGAQVLRSLFQYR